MFYPFIEMPFEALWSTSVVFMSYINKLVLTRSITGPHRNAQPFTLSITQFRVANELTMQVFGLWEETGVPREKSCYKKNKILSLVTLRFHFAVCIQTFLAAQKMLNLSKKMDIASNSLIVSKNGDEWPFIHVKWMASSFPDGEKKELEIQLKFIKSQKQVKSWFWRMEQEVRLPLQKAPICYSQLLNNFEFHSFSKTWEC